MQKMINKINRAYYFEKRIGLGSFGDVYLVTNNETKEQFAAKIEDKKKTKHLAKEFKMYELMVKHGFTDGLPKIIHYEEDDIFRYMYMELLDENLDKIFNNHNKKFTLDTVLKLGHDITVLLERMHKTGFIHRDIKPNNFMFDQHKTKLYIMDFGLSKKYILKNKHNIYKTDRSMVGTARYTSINIHMGKEASRRDDLESVSYMLIYFMLGELPWQGLAKKDDIDHLENIGNVKLTTNIKKLCKNIPECFLKYHEYCRELKYEQEPDYNYLKGLFGTPKAEWSFP